MGSEKRGMTFSKGPFSGWLRLHTQQEVSIQKEAEEHIKWLERKHWTGWFQGLFQTSCTMKVKLLGFKCVALLHKQPASSIPCYHVICTTAFIYSWVRFDNRHHTASKLDLLTNYIPQTLPCVHYTGRIHIHWLTQQHCTLKISLQVL